MANLNLSQFGEKLFVADADHTFIWDTAASISKRVSRNSWLSAGSIATSTPLTISQTWTDAAVAFAVMKIVATDTNSAAGSDFLELYSGTSTQPLRMDINKTGQINAYGTWTDAGNYERLAFNPADSTFSAEPSITTQQAGSGVSRQLNIGTTGTADLRLATNSLWRWRVGGSTGHLLAHTDNAYDIGASGASRPRNVYVGSSIVLGTATFNANGFTFPNKFIISESGADGRIAFYNGSGGSISRLQLGGVTDTFPAIAPDGAGIKFTGAAAGSTSWIKVPPVAVGSLPLAATAGAGARAFVNDALSPTFGSAVTGGGAVLVPVYSTGSAWNVG